MKRCLCPGRLLCLDRRSHLLHTSSVSLYRLLSYSQRKGLPVGRPFSGRRQWGRQFSSPSIDRRLLRDHVQTENKKSPIAGSQQKNPEAWILLLEQYLLPSSEPGAASQESLTRTIELSSLLFDARHYGNLDLLAHLGYRLNNWPAVYTLLSQLLDATDALNDASLTFKTLSNNSWGYESSVSLDQFTGQGIESAPQLPPDPAVQVSELTSLDSLTERPFADDHSRRFMAQVWQSLGSIVLGAADVSPNDSKLAMSYVFRILARLHHSGAVSDRVYKYATPDSHQVAFRPPTMHLLSNHIMSVLSDAVWLVHEAEVAAKAAAAGEDSPFLPFKMGIRELGPEIWLEFILWCCVEHGHITEGIWLIDQIKTRKGDLAWKFQSWRPLLEHPESVWKTKVDSEVSWRHPAQVDGPSSLRKRSSPSPFNGLGERTISLEVAASLLDNLPNWVYRGLGFRGITSAVLLRHISSLKFTIAQGAMDDTPLATSKGSNWFTLRVLESGCIDPEADPRAFDEFIRAIPHIVPPWESNDLHVPDEEELEQLQPSQIYDETTALATLIEHNIRFYSRQRLCGDAMDSFTWLQTVVDKSKMQRIGEFFSSRVDLSHDEHLPTFDSSDLASLKPFESSMPQISAVTLAEILDLVTVSRAFTFGEWLLFSNDIDGPPIPSSAYGDQALAPSIIRFAAATKNSALCDSVVQSLTQPLSANTLRALLNYRITMYQWDLVTVILEYLRGYRSKSWGHSNVTALAAEIIRLDHIVKTESDATKAEDHTRNLEQAKNILLRILDGEFNELHPRDNYQERSLYGLHRLFLSIPGALHDLAASSNLRSQKIARSTIPHVPPTAFHPILSAVVDTQGSTAGKRLWDTWCVDVQSPSTRRLQKGGIPRLYLNKERDPKKGDPHFDERYFKHVQKKLILPNLTTVRIIAQAALKEHEAYEAQHQRPVADASSPAQSSTIDYSQNPARGVLEFCIKKFEALGLRRPDINREVGGLVYRRQKELRRMKKQRLQREGALVQEDVDRE
ncbi:uncharacterized protein BDW43DRAFT_287005 [Aspergillus alliaceus]|uniref:uncharacterized protein n=1 Tax=Petromyces alliaceus TaxID=209559 RepID=UPI0012A76C6B|nr:uncharacterized protein BDW43DRAFT_287005 [Aspergillus alliaceus]KAB8229979.1 hypothetical protein BDW43DRAFT_287005 [Aspergillus alliaceus]